MGTSSVRGNSPECAYWPFHGGNTGSSPVGRANARFPFGHGSKATRQPRLPRAAVDRLRLLGQFRAGYHARGLRPVHVAPLHAVRRQDRADRIAIVVDHQNRVVTRDRGDENVPAKTRPSCLSMVTVKATLLS